MINITRYADEAVTGADALISHWCWVLKYYSSPLFAMTRFGLRNKWTNERAALHFETDALLWQHRLKWVIHGLQIWRYEQSMKLFLARSLTNVVERAAFSSIRWFCKTEMMKWLWTRMEERKLQKNLFTSRAGFYSFGFFLHQLADRYVILVKIIRHVALCGNLLIFQCRKGAQEDLKVAEHHLKSSSNSNEFFADPRMQTTKW